MNDNINNDKLKIEEILEEIQNLKKYSRELANNTSGEKLENFIDSLSKDINQFEINVEKIYEEQF